MTWFRLARAGRHILTAGLLLGGCATRTVPDHWPAGAAASAKAPIPRRVVVTRSLEAEPGAQLAAPDAGSAPADHGAHHHHGGPHAH